MTPRSWTELLDRLAYQLGGRSRGFQAEAEEWTRSAVRARFGVESLHDLDRGRRQVAFQKCAGVVLALEDGDDVALRPDCRDLVRAAFARYFDGVAADGPPWRISPAEDDRPTRDEWLADPADFGGEPAAAVTG